MSILEWRNFNFFKLVQHPDSNKLQKIKSAITCQCFNTFRQTRIFCDVLGWVHVYPRNWEPISFQINSSAINLCATTPENYLLLTLVQNQTSCELNLQIFNLQQITKRGGAPCVSTAKLTHPNKPTVMKACMIDFALCIAIGFENGNICFHRGAINRDISSSFRTLLVCSREIVGIEFWKKDSHALYMFISSSTSVFCYSISESNTLVESKVTLDSTSAKTSRCCALLSKNSYEPNAFFTVGRDDAVYCFTCDGRGPCYVIDGKKERVAWFNNNLLVVTQVEKRCMLIIVDILNKLIVLEKNMDMITDIVVENSSCYIFTATKKVFQLRERSLERKLCLLVEKNLYDIALHLLSATEDNTSNIGNLYRQYGDYLVHKGNISGAIDKYIRTIGYIEPYPVLKKLLNFKHNKYLEQYLTAYVRMQNKAEHYMHLLENCRERLNLALMMEHICLGKVVTKSRIEFETQPSSDNIKCSTFLSSLDDPQKMHQHFASLQESDVVMDFLLEHRSIDPIHISNTLKSLCCKHIEGNELSYPEKFLPLLIPYSTYCIEFLEFLIENDFKFKATLHKLLFELYLRMWRNENENTTDIISFIKSHGDLCLPDILIICSNHSFWPGILYIYERNNQRHLYARYFIKNYDKENSVFPNEQCSSLRSDIWIPTLIKGDISSVSSTALINNIITTQLRHRELSFIQILQTVSTNENFMVLHMKNFFSPEHPQHHGEENKFKNMYDDILICKQLYSCLLKNPIEFRVSTCDICKQQLELPAIYFLCQHSFHKDCLSTYSGKKCVICVASSKQNNTRYSCINLKTNLMNNMEQLCSILSYRIFDGFIRETNFQNKISHASAVTNHTKLIETNAKWAGRFLTDNIFDNTNQIAPKQYGNPFESALDRAPSTKSIEYDDNLNPFKI